MYFNLDNICFSDDIEIQKQLIIQQAEKCLNELYNTKADNELRLLAPADWLMDNFNAQNTIAYIGVNDCTFHEAVNNVIAGSSAIISGDTDTGKSMLAVAIARILSERGNRVARFKDFSLARMAEINRFRATAEFSKKIELCKKIELLIIDDVGKNKLYKSSIELTYYGNVLFDIVDHRAEHQLSTIITTRAKNSIELTTMLGNDFLRRIKLSKHGKHTASNFFLKIEGEK